MMKSMAERTGPAIALLVVVAVVTGGSISAIQTAAGVESATSGNPSSRTDLRPSVDADDVLLRVNLRSDGSAVWEVEYRIRLDDANATEAFEELQSDVEANESAYRSQFAARIKNTVSNAENRTGREMAATNFTVTTDRRQLPQEYGVVAYSFEWHGFAQTDAETLRVGDALAGLFLDAETTLLVAWPDGYAVSTVSPTPDETRPRAVVWTGPTDFSSGEPTLLLGPATTTTETTSTAETTTERTATTAAGESSDDDDSGGLPTALLAAVLLALVAGGVVAVRRRATDDRATPDDAELLTNEERVLELLEANGGRVKQQAVVEELDWTEAKTSRVVAALNEDGRIEVLRLGRENVLSLTEDST